MTTHTVSGDVDMSHGVALTGGVTTAAPFDRPAVWVRCLVDGEDDHVLPGRALGWTLTRVQAEVDLDGQRFEVWVSAGRVTRR